MEEKPTRQQPRFRTDSNKLAEINFLTGKDMCVKLVNNNDLIRRVI